MNKREPLYTVLGPKLLHEMTMKEVKNKLEKTDAVVLAGASTEGHGNHLPLATDAIEAEELLRLVVHQLENDNCPIVGGPVIPFGPTTDRLGFSGTLSISNSTMIALVKEICHSLYHHGFRKFALLMYHYDNMAPMTVAVRELIDEFSSDAKVMMLQGFLRVGDRDLLPTISDSKHPDWEGHGGELETSRTIAARKELVYLDEAEPSYPVTPPSFSILYDKQVLHGGSIFQPPRDYHVDVPLGYVGNPTLATEKKGKYSNEVMATWVSNVLRREFFERTTPLPEPVWID
jgi:creatinine amidohydrolase